MRIRKHAARFLLGTQQTSAVPHSSSPTSSSLLPASSPPPSRPRPLDGVCKLNLSPWDLVIDLNAMPQEEQDDNGRGIMGNCDKLEEVVEVEAAEEPVAVNAAIADEAAAEVINISEEEEEKVNIDGEVMEKRTEEAMRCCNKKGKGWRCSQPAAPDHSFCSHHMAGLRSRNSKHSAADEEAFALVPGPKSDVYCYYDGFRPPAVKRRAQADHGVEITIQAPTCKNIAAKLTRKSNDVVDGAAATTDSNSSTAYGGFKLWQGKRRGGADLKDERELGAPVDHGPLSLGVEKDQDQQNSEGKSKGAVGCKKSDGKGWHCKKLSVIGTSYCSHHLALLKSYSSNNAAIDNAAMTEPQANKRRRAKRTIVTGVAASQSSSYYYYTGFGPWRGKTRGQVEENKQEEENIVGKTIDVDCNVPAVPNDELAGL